MTDKQEPFIQWRDDSHIVIGVILKARSIIGDQGVQDALEAINRLLAAYEQPSDE